jgi:hypothetical protein
MRRSLLLAGVLALALAAAAQPTTRFGRRAKAKAKADAATQLAAALLPHSARKVHGDQSIGHMLRRPSEGCIPKYVVDDHAFWRVPGAPSSVQEWIRKHPPPHVTTILTAQGPSYSYVAFMYADQQAVTGRLLQLTVAPAKGGGSALRGDGAAAWEPQKGQSPCLLIG